MSRAEPQKVSMAEILRLADQEECEHIYVPEEGGLRISNPDKHHWNKIKLTFMRIENQAFNYVYYEAEVPHELQSAIHSFSTSAVKSRVNTIRRALNLDGSY